MLIAMVSREKYSIENYCLADVTPSTLVGIYRQCR